MSEEAKEDKKLEIMQSELDKMVEEARIKGSNMLYSELISYQFGLLEVFAAKFVPQNSTYPKFLAFVIFTLQQIYEDKYSKKEEKKDEEKSREERVEEKGNARGEGSENEEAAKESAETP